MSPASAHKSAGDLDWGVDSAVVCSRCSWRRGRRAGCFLLLPTYATLWHIVINPHVISLIARGNAPTMMQAARDQKSSRTLKRTKRGDTIVSGRRYCAGRVAPAPLVA